MSSIVLFQIALVILACILLRSVSFRLGAPALLAIILLGLLFGNHGVISIGHIGFPMAQRLCEMALIFIIFYSGFDTRWKSAKEVLVEASLLSTVGVFLTFSLIGAFCHLLLKWSWSESMLIGAVLASTDSASVFSILKSRKLNLKGRLAPLIEVESGSNDPMAHMLTVVMISMMGGKMKAGEALLDLGVEIVLGVLIGLLIAKSAGVVLRNLRIRNESFNTLLIFAVAILAFSLPDIIGGNGYLSVYIVGLLLGNENFAGKKSMIHFFDGLTTLMELLLFFVLGALANPESFIRVIVPALAIYAFILIVARPLSVNAILLPFRHYNTLHRDLVSFSGLRGAASIVFAVLAVNQAAPENDILNVVFCVVMLSMTFQGSLLPSVSRFLGAIDSKSDYRLTFNDFDDDELQFGRIELTHGNVWIGKTIHDVALPEGITIGLIIRDGEVTVPRSSMELEEDDVIVTVTKPFHSENVRFKDKTVKVDSRRVGHPIKEYPGNSRIIMIKRSEECIIPDGNTVLQSGDHLIILDAE